MEPLRVRLYNVRFGDAILIIVPDTENGVPKTRYILIDVGNALNREGGKDFVFKSVLEDIEATLNGAEIDLFVMTHEHLDHIQGLFYGVEKENLSKLPVNTSWLTASAEEGYYDRDWSTEDENGNTISTPKQHFEQMKRSLDLMLGFSKASELAGMPLARRLWATLNNNNPRRSAHCVNFLRGLADQTHYVYRGIESEDGSNLHPFESAELELWGPEENTAIYYGHFRPMALGVEGTIEGGDDSDNAPSLVTPTPPPGVDASAFYNLVDARRNGFVDNLLTIDKARNNSSVVFSLVWNGWKLLFPGDAEVRSWKEMDKRNMLSDVHFLKVSHHASHNGTPDDELLEKILPENPLDDRDRVAVASTFPNTYNGIPHQETLGRLEARGVRTYTIFEELGDVPASDDKEESIPKMGYIEFTFPADGTTIDMTTHRF